MPSSQSGSENDVPGPENISRPAKATVIHDEKRSKLQAQLKGIFEKVPPESLYDVLVNGLMSGLDNISVGDLEALVTSTEEEADIFLDNPPPPSLNAAELKREVGVLIDELYRLSAETMNSKEPRWDEWTFVLEQIADSLTAWLQKVWLCVWEYRTSFEKAHDCLMIIQGFMETLTAPKLGCVCPFTTLPLVITFRDLTGEIVQTWNTHSGGVLQEVIFWTWRELFMSILIKRRPQYEPMLQGMIRDIELSQGGSHHIILFGGSPDGYGIGGYYNEAAMDLEDSETDDSEIFDDTIGEFWSDHWDALADEYEELKDILLEAARKFFAAHPTFHGYLTLCSLEPCRGELHDLLLENAPFSRAATLCALTVFQHRHSLDLIQEVLTTSGHLLEAHDVPFVCRAAACLLAHPESAEFGLQFMQEQLIDSLECIKIALHNTFKLDRIISALGTLTEISSLTLRTPDRTAKVKAWVKDILLPGSSTTDPFSLAAMVMGFPVMEEVEEEEEEEGSGGDFFESTHAIEFDGLLDSLSVTCTRPHLHDLCHLNRRHLVKRLTTLLSLMDELPQTAKPGRSKLLLAFEKAIFKELPWMRYPDVVSELKAKYGRRRNEGHLKSAIEALQGFVDKQKAHHARVRAARKKAADAAKPARPVPTGPFIDDVD